MKKAKLPVEKAVEPHEEARQPLVSENPIKTKPHVKFSEEIPDNVPASQTSTCSYRGTQLSQPAPGIPHRQKLAWLQKRRISGLWVQCDDCTRWRYLADVLDRYELPQKWYCRMNPDPTNADCSVPEAPIPVRDEEDLIYGEYSAGSVVWARMHGYPWWPAMVDDCPDTEQYYWLDGLCDIPTHYNVVFFDSGNVTRAWIAPEELKPYTAYKTSMTLSPLERKYEKRMKEAVKQADDAVQLPLRERLEKYSFLTTYKGKIATPKKIKKSELKKQSNVLKRKFNIEFEMSDSEDIRPKPKARNNVIILGTPKKATRAKAVSKVKDAMLVSDAEKSATYMEKDELDALLVSETEIVEQNTQLNPKESENCMEKDELNALLVSETRTMEQITQPNAKESDTYMVKDHLDALLVSETEIMEKNTQINAKESEIFMDKDELYALLASGTELVENSKKPNAQESETLFEKKGTEQNTEISTETTKTASLAVQVGSNTELSAIEESFDDDTSKTYVPENLKESEDSTQITQTTDTFFRDYTVQIKSPDSVHSDDFEY